VAYSKQSRRRFVQKAFWIRKDLGRRLEKVVKARRKKGEKSFCERIAFGLALRDFVDRMEAELGIDRPRSALAVPTPDKAQG
jgi:hypothetical protein